MIHPPQHEGGARAPGTVAATHALPHMCAHTRMCACCSTGAEVRMHTHADACARMRSSHELSHSTPTLTHTQLDAPSTNQPPSELIRALLIFRPSSVRHCTTSTSVPGEEEDTRCRSGWFVWGVLEWRKKRRGTGRAAHGKRGDAYRVGWQNQ